MSGQHECTVDRERSEAIALHEREAALNLTFAAESVHEPDIKEFRDRAVWHMNKRDALKASDNALDPA
jgi:hypothetical protein